MDIRRAKDILRTYAASTYDLLKDAYTGKVSVWEWENEISNEAVGIICQCWDAFRVQPHSSNLADMLREAIVSHLGRPLKEGRIMMASPGAPSTRPSVFAPVSLQDSPLLTMAKAGLLLGTDSSRRKAFIQPLLDEKGWTVFDWAQKANVSHHTASDYLSAKRKTQPYNRKKLADAIGISLQQLPK